MLARFIAMPKSVFSDAYRHFLTLLIDARKSKNITQKVLAKRLGKPQSLVSKYETGERRLDVIEFLDIALALDIDPVPIIRELVAMLRKKKLED